MARKKGPPPGEPQKTTALVPAESRGGSLVAAQRDLYLEWLGTKGTRTVEAYRENILRIADWSGFGSGEEFTKALLTRGPGEANGLAMRFKAEKQKPTTEHPNGWSPSYINNHLSALRSLLKFARLTGKIAWGIEVEGLKVQILRDTRGPGLKGVAALIVAARKGPAAKRNTAILMLFATRGLRRDEICSLDLEHVDLHNSRVLVKRKGKPQREWLTVPKGTMNAISSWIEDRGRDPGPLFKSFGVGKRRKDGRLAESSLNWLLDKLAVEAGIGRAWPHGLRHTAITQVLELNNGNVLKAQRFAGHEGPAMTIRYEENRTDVAGEMANELEKKLMEELEGQDGCGD